MYLSFLYNCTICMFKILKKHFVEYLKFKFESLNKQTNV